MVIVRRFILRIITYWLVSFILGLLFLGFYQGVKQKKHYIRNGLLLVLCICMMFPVTFGMTRYLPPVFHHPVWFWGEWSEERVHSWDAWNSEKYVDIDDVLNIAIRRTREITDDLVGRSPFMLKVFAAELDKVQVLKDEQSADQFLIRETIYSQYWKNLNLMGHKQKDQGFQLFSWYWIGHAHNIYLQYATDFGIPMCICFIGICIGTLIRIVKNNLQTEKTYLIGYIFLILVPLLFGLLEFSWGSGAVTIVLLFIGWRQGICDN